MSVEKVRAYLEPFGVSDRIREFDVSSATVELAAVAVGVEPARIAKTLSFRLGDAPILVVTAGDAKIDNSKYKHFFGMKAKMLTPEEAVERIGHAVGGVCPFALPEDVKTYLGGRMQGLAGGDGWLRFFMRRISTWTVPSGPCRRSRPACGGRRAGSCPAVWWTGPTTTGPG